MKIKLLEHIIAARKSNREVALATYLASGAQEIFFPDRLVAGSRIAAAIEEAFRRDRSSLVELDGEQVFIQVFSNPLRMIIVGAVHIAKPLIEMGRLCDYAVTLIDPRLAFASEERFPKVEIKRQWPDVALREMAADRRTAVVTLTHDPKLDEPALSVALESDAFYIGALGSRRTHRARCERLTEAGISEPQLKRICGPIGLDIGAQSPAEIAVSIMAEITKALHKKNLT